MTWGMVVRIEGPRRSGKTTLASTLLAKLLVGRRHVAVVDRGVIDGRLGQVSGDDVILVADAIARAGGLCVCCTEPTFVESDCPADRVLRVGLCSSRPEESVDQLLVDAELALMRRIQYGVLLDMTHHEPCVVADFVMAEMRNRRMI